MTPGQGCGCARCLEPLPQPAAGEGAAEVYAALRAQWRAVYLAWEGERALPGSPVTARHVDPLIPAVGP